MGMDVNVWAVTGNSGYISC